MSDLASLALAVAIYLIGCAACYAAGRWHERRRQTPPERPLVSDTYPHVESMQNISQRLARFEPPIAHR